MCAGSELSTRALRKVFSSTLFPIYVAVAENVIGEASNECQGLHRDQLGQLFIGCFFLI
jgi:hypothetical protein